MADILPPINYLAGMLPYLEIATIPETGDLLDTGTAHAKNILGNGLIYLITAVALYSIVKLFLIAAIVLVAMVVVGGCVISDSFRENLWNRATMLCANAWSKVAWE